VRPKPTLTPLLKNVAHGTRSAPSALPSGARVEILLGVDPRDRHAASRIDQSGEVGDDLGGVLARGVLAIARLEADGVDAALDAVHPLLADRQPASPAQLPDLLDGVANFEVDGRRSDLAGLVEPLRDVVDDVDLARAAQQRAVRGQQPDRARAEDRDGRARLHVRQLGGVPAGDERVGEHHEVVLAIIAGLAGQRHAVGVGERDAQQLRLRPAVVAHAGIAVGRAEAARPDAQARAV
jgi:hypothetical protein